MPCAEVRVRRRVALDPGRRHESGVAMTHQGLAKYVYAVVCWDRELEWTRTVDDGGSEGKSLPR